MAKQIRVGSVDLFQGQQAAVAITSLGSSSGVGESRSEAMGRYMSSRRSDVSDPSLWNYLHYGDEISDESPSQEVD